MTMSDRAVAALVLGLVLAPPPRAAETFADDFSRDDLARPDRYLRTDPPIHPRERHPVWRVVEGALRLDTNGSIDGRLNILAQRGERWRLRCRMRFLPSVDGHGHFAGGVLFCHDYRRGDDLYFGFYKGPKNTGIQINGRGFDDWKDFPVAPERWYEVEIARDGERFKVSVDRAPCFERTLARRPRPPGAGARPAFQNEPLDHGGFALLARHIPGEGSIECDDLSIDGVPPPARADARAPPKLARRRPFELRSGPAECVVLHYPGAEAWADRLHDEAPPFIAAMEEIMGTPPCTDVLGYNQQRGTYFEDGPNGFNEWGLVLAGTGTAGIGGHEETHHWQHLYGHWWTNVGAADFFRHVFMERRGAFPRLSGRRVAAEGLALLVAPPKGFDFGFALDPTPPPAVGPGGEVGTIMRAGGLKARLFYYILYRTIGLEGLQKIHRRAAEEKVPLKSAEMKLFADEIAGRDLGPVFAGWVFAGKGRHDIFDVVRDGDGDGLSDLDEDLAGTDRAKPDTDGDGLSDRFELERGLGPLDPLDRARFVEPIAPDGIAGEWEWSEPVLVAPSGDGKSGPDIASVKAWTAPRSDVLHLCVAFHKPLPAGDVAIQLDLDPGAAGRWTHRLNVWPLREEADFFLPSPAAGEARRTVPARVELGIGRTAIEVAIPLEPLGSPERVLLGVVAGEDRVAEVATVRTRYSDEPVRADGDLADWSEVLPAAEDPEGDGAGALDLRVVAMLPRADRIYVALTHDGEAPPDAAVQLDLDAGADGSWEHRIVATPARREASVWALAGAAQGPLGNAGVILGVQPGAIELEVPLHRIGRAERFAISVSLHSGGKSDWAPGFIVVELPGS